MGGDGPLHIFVYIMEMISPCAIKHVLEQDVGIRYQMHYISTLKLLMFKLSPNVLSGTAAALDRDICSRYLAPN